MVSVEGHLVSPSVRSQLTCSPCSTTYRSLPSTGFTWQAKPSWFVLPLLRHFPIAYIVSGVLQRSNTTGTASASRDESLGHELTRVDVNPGVLRYIGRARWVG